MPLAKSPGRPMGHLYKYPTTLQQLGIARPTLHQAIGSPRCIPLETPIAATIRLYLALVVFMRRVCTCVRACVRLCVCACVLCFLFVPSHLFPSISLRIVLPTPSLFLLQIRSCVEGAISTYSACVRFYIEKTFKFVSPRRIASNCACMRLAAIDTRMPPFIYQEKVPWLA